MAGKVVVFLDYQNVYMGAREAFHSFGSPSQDGQVDPLKLGELIVTKSPFDRELVSVRIYRGQPDSQRDPRGYAANDRQCEYWRRLPKTTAITRTLQYPRGWPKEKAREKGVLMSRDTDLKPALEFVRDLNGNPCPRCEVAAWSAPSGHSRRLSVPGGKIWCHWLDESDYEAVADPNNYAGRSDS